MQHNDIARLRITRRRPFRRSERERAAHLRELEHADLKSIPDDLPGDGVPQRKGAPEFHAIADAGTAVTREVDDKVI